MHRNLCVLFLISSACVPAAEGVNSRNAASFLAHQPVRFEPDGGGRFVARGMHYEFSLAPEGATVRTSAGVVRLRFDGARPATLEGAERLASTTNLMLGNDRSKWRQGIPNFGRVIAHQLYPGVDAVYYGAEGHLEYDLVLSPGADPRQVRLRFDGIGAKLDADGNLEAGLVHKRPLTWQVAADGTRKTIPSRFRRNADGTFGFNVAHYDSKCELVIDPQVTLASYLGGTQEDIGVAVGHDAQGSVYLGGTTYSTDFPILTDTALQTVNKGLTDVFVAKINSALQVVYVTYLGGAGADVLNDMVVNAAGTVYLAGSTESVDFPLGNAAQGTRSGTRDGFVLALDPSQVGAGGMQYGTYLGGSDVDACTGIALDPGGRILVTGYTKSKDFPSTSGWSTTYSGNQDAFVAVLDPLQSATATLVYGTYLGGTNWDMGHGIASAADGTLWVVGGTISGDFPIVGLSHQFSYGTGGDAFVAHINPNVAGASSLLYTSYLGGSNTDEANSVFVDAAGRVIIAGYTLSTDFPVTSTAVQKQLGGQPDGPIAADAFVAVLNPANIGTAKSQLVYGTYLGGGDGDEAYSVKADAAGNIYVGGLTKSKDFKVTSGALVTTLAGGPGGFVARLNPARTTLDYSSYIASEGTQTVYGVDVNSKGTIFLAGFTSGPLLDNIIGVLRVNDVGNSDAFVLGFDPGLGSASTSAAQSANRIARPAGSKRMANSPHAGNSEDSLR